MPAALLLRVLLGTPAGPCNGVFRAHGTHARLVATGMIAARRARTGQVNVACERKSRFGVGGTPIRFFLAGVR
jgi:hypothetical protein